MPLLITGLCLPIWASTEGLASPGDPRRSELREAVETHRSVRPEQVRREEAWTGRHLTPPELAELREQVRQQWAGYGDRRALSSPLQAAPRSTPSSVAGEPAAGQVWPTRARQPQ